MPRKPRSPRGRPNEERGKGSPRTTQSKIPHFGKNRTEIELRFSWEILRQFDSSIAAHFRTKGKDRVVVLGRFIDRHAKECVVLFDPKKNEFEIW